MKNASEKKANRWKVLFCGFVTLLILSFLHADADVSIASYEGKDIEAILQMMPKRDKERLEYFFLNSIDWEAMGYVLFGNKPMAYLEGVEKKLEPFKNFRSFQYAISPRRIQAENGFKTWRKYEKLFPMRRFVFLYEESDDDVIGIFINKESFSQKVRDCAEDFRNILKREVTGEQLLAEAAYKPLLSEVLQNHEILLGILFGFGRDNAYAFYQRSLLASKEQKRDFQEAFYFGDPWEKEFEDLEKKLEKVSWISSNITGDHLKNLELIMYPGFYALLDHPETTRLKEYYTSVRKEMIDYYKDKDFLEATLKLMTSD